MFPVLVEHAQRHGHTVKRQVAEIGNQAGFMHERGVFLLFVDKAGDMRLRQSAGREYQAVQRPCLVLVLLDFPVEPGRGGYDLAKPGIDIDGYTGQPPFLLAGFGDVVMPGYVEIAWGQVGQGQVVRIGALVHEPRPDTDVVRGIPDERDGAAVILIVIDVVHRIERGPVGTGNVHPVKHAGILRIVKQRTGAQHAFHDRRVHAAVHPPVDVSLLDVRNGCPKIAVELVGVRLFRDDAHCPAHGAGPVESALGTAQDLYPGNIRDPRVHVFRHRDVIDVKAGRADHAAARHPADRGRARVEAAIGFITETQVGYLDTVVEYALGADTLQLELAQGRDGHGRILQAGLTLGRGDEDLLDDLGPACRRRYREQQKQTPMPNVGDNIFFNHYYLRNRCSRMI